MATRVPIAFLAGLVSVITPCVLPLVPGYLSAVSAVEATRLGQRGLTRRIVVSSLPFILGFSVVFVALGAGSAAIGGAFGATRQTEVAGFVLVVLGVFAFRWSRSREPAAAAGPPLDPELERRLDEELARFDH